MFTPNNNFIDIGPPQMGAVVPVQDFGDGLYVWGKRFHGQGCQRRSSVAPFLGMTAGLIGHDYNEFCLYHIGSEQRLFVGVIAPKEFQLEAAIFRAYS
jgi:hypothetical protein